MNDITKAAALKIDRARWWALQKQPFYAALAMRLTDSFANPAVPVAATDGKFIYWSAQWAANATDQDIRFVLVHESLHPALGHLWRLKHDRIANIAADHEINLQLRALAPDATMPTGGVADPRFTDVPCEIIDSTLRDEEQKQEPEEQDGEGDDEGEPGDGEGQDGQHKPGKGKGKPKPGKADGSDTGPCGGFIEPAPETSGQDPAEAAAQSEALREQWQEAVIQAAQAAAAAGRGDVPGHMRREIERLTHQKVDWKTEMQEFVKSAVATRNDWTRSARRHSWQKCIVPRRRAEGLGVIVFVRDTSGSIDGPVISQFTALIEQCMVEQEAAGIVMDVDTRICGEYEVDATTAWDTLSKGAKGGGGTCFRDVPVRVKAIEESGVRVAGIVVCTDLYGSDFETDTPTLWLSITDRVGSCGRTVQIEG